MTLRNWIVRLVATFSYSYTSMTEVRGPYGLWKSCWRCHAKWEGLYGCNPATTAVF